MWKQLSSLSCMKTSWDWLMMVYPPHLSTHGQQWSRHGKMIGVLWTHIIHLWWVHKFIFQMWFLWPLVAGASETEIRQHLTLEEEEEQMRLGKSGPKHYTHMKFLLYGLDIEHSQYVLYILSSSGNWCVHRQKLCAIVAQYNHTKLPVSIIEQHTALQRQLAKLCNLQAMYQPELATIATPLDDDVVDVSLCLPSSLPPKTCANSSPKLVQMERELCLGQCHDSLLSLQLHLHSRSQLLKDKYLNVHHQGPNTKSWKLVNWVSARISACADKYRAACSALDTLDPDPAASWHNELLILQAKDIHGMSEPKLPNHPDLECAKAIQTRALLNRGVFPDGTQ